MAGLRPARFLTWGQTQTRSPRAGARAEPLLLSLLPPCYPPFSRKTSLPPAGGHSPRRQLAPGLGGGDRQLRQGGDGPPA